MADSIRTKEQFYHLYHAGLLGNTIRQWDWVDWREMFYVRQEPKDVLGWAVRVKIPDNPYMKYEMTADQCYAYACELEHRHRVPEAKIQVSELCWDFGASAGRENYLTLQGEFRRSGGECRPPIHGKFNDHFYAAPARNRMRYSMHRAVQVEGLDAWLKLKSACDAPSWEMLMELLDQYPNDTFEFASYARPVGVMQVNTIVWEVRGY